MLRRALLLGCLMGTPPWILAAVTEIPPGARLVLPEARGPAPAQVAADAAPALAALRRGDAAGAEAALRALRDVERYEAAAVAVIDAIPLEAPSAAAHALLAVLAREPVRLYRRHDESASHWYLPVYDVPGRAASARTLLARIAARDRLLPELRRGRAEALQDVEAAVAAAAIETLTQHEAAELADALLAQPDGIEASAWSALARRAPTLPVLAAALDRAPPHELTALLQELPVKIAPEVALPWLDQAATRPALRSLAIAGYGRLAPQQPKALARLEAALADAQDGPSAAAAFARLEVGDRVERIGKLLDAAQEPQMVARLALALRLEGSPAAQQRLAALRGDPRLDAALRQELQP